MEAAESGVAFLAHIALKDGRIGLAKIDDHQAIHNIGELPVEVESNQLATYFVVLPDQDRRLPSSSTS